MVILWGWVFLVSKVHLCGKIWRQVCTPKARSYLTESAYKVVLQKSVPAQIRPLILYVSNDIGQVDGFVRELTFVNQLDKHLL
jgi:hypothetical protein